MFQTMKATVFFYYFSEIVDFCLFQGEEGLVHFQWLDRTQNVVEDVSYLPPPSIFVCLVIIWMVHNVVPCLQWSNLNLFISFTSPLSDHFSVSCENYGASVVHRMEKFQFLLYKISYLLKEKKCIDEGILL